MDDGKKQSALEKISAICTAAFFAERAAEAEIELARRLLRRPGGQLPDRDDCLR